ncbi:hypothetical protein NPIL_128221 [Nephila pilipes]|uniref:Uncharacterized protein n=1 Tax=Nephila pilipes TaxID=299642 RepID=A0A8X6P8G2_NEPPI|nr:hypothetical protein NPIL_128221 [Nephila pilipes]
MPIVYKPQYTGGEGTHGISAPSHEIALRRNNAYAPHRHTPSIRRYVQFMPTPQPLQAATNVTPFEPVLGIAAKPTYQEAERQSPKRTQRFEGSRRSAQKTCPHRASWRPQDTPRNAHRQAMGYAEKRDSQRHEERPMNRLTTTCYRRGMLE